MEAGSLLLRCQTDRPTATPDKRTFGFFNENIVAQYRYEQSVDDGVNVGSDVYLIETDITLKVAELKAREWVAHHDRQTRKKRWQETEENMPYTGPELYPRGRQSEPDPLGHPGPANDH